MPSVALQPSWPQLKSSPSSSAAPAAAASSSSAVRCYSSAAIARDPAYQASLGAAAALLARTGRRAASRVEVNSKWGDRSNKSRPRPKSKCS